MEHSPSQREDLLCQTQKLLSLFGGRWEGCWRKGRVKELPVFLVAWQKEKEEGRSQFEKSKNLRKKEKKAPYPPPPSYPMIAVMKSKRPSRFKTQVNIDPSNVSSPLTCILYRWHPLSRLDPNAIFSMDKEVDKERQRQQPR